MNHALRVGTTRLWRTYPREILAVGLLTFASSAVLAGNAWSSPTLDGLSEPAAAAVPAAAVPAVQPLLVRDLAPQDAVAVNSAIPVDSGPNPAARPFSLGNVDQATRSRALECLTSAVYYEAANESADGKRAVAQVVLNRVRHPAFPASVCGVVYEGSTRSTGCQFTFTCDGSLARRPIASLWETSRKVAWAALNGTVHKPVGTATHYHANYVVPYWASSLIKNAVVGAHIFYRWTGGWGQPSAFTLKYAGHEPDSQALRMAAVEAQAALAKAALTEDGTIEVVAESDLAAIEANMPKSPVQNGKRVGARFNAAAREAVEAAIKVPYVEKVAASDNLRWTLSGGSKASSAKALGGAAPAKDAPAPAPAAAIASSSATITAAQ